MDLWSIGGGSSASRSAKFGVVVFTGSLLKWGVNLSLIHATPLHPRTLHKVSVPYAICEPYVV